MLVEVLLEILPESCLLRVAWFLLKKFVGLLSVAQQLRHSTVTFEPCGPNHF